MESLREYKLGVTERNIEDDVKTRIVNDFEFFHGAMPNDVALAWNGYLQGTRRWAPAATPRLIVRLLAMLPQFRDDSSVECDQNDYSRDDKLAVTPEQLQSETANLIEHDIRRFGGALPRDIAASWSGYIQAIGEWAPAMDRRVIRSLRGMFPEIENDPASASAGCRDFLS